MLSRRTRRSAGLLAITLSMLATLAVAAPVAAQGPPGNNGTVKIHDDFEAEPIVRNEPHVSCNFHLHFFFSDSNQTGDWWIESWPPTGDMTTVMGPAAYGPTNGAGEWATGSLSLSAGHYKLYWEGRNDHNIKHKVFWVDPCQTTVVPPPPPPPPPSNGGSGVEGGSSGSQGSIPAPRSGTAASSGGPAVVAALPDTAMGGATSGALLIVGLILVSGAAVSVVAVRSEARDRRR